MPEEGYLVEKVDPEDGGVFFYLYEAEATGGDPDYTTIYEISTASALKVGEKVEAKLVYTSVSRDSMTQNYKAYCLLK